MCNGRTMSCANQLRRTSSPVLGLAWKGPPTLGGGSFFSRTKREQLARDEMGPAIIQRLAGRFR